MYSQCTYIKYVSLKHFGLECFGQAVRPVNKISPSRWSLLESDHHTLSYPFQVPKWNPMYSWLFYYLFFMLKLLFSFTHVWPVCFIVFISTNIPYLLQAYDAPDTFPHIFKQHVSKSVEQTIQNRTRGMGKGGTALRVWRKDWAPITRYFEYILPLDYGSYIS